MEWVGCGLVLAGCGGLGSGFAAEADMDDGHGDAGPHSSACGFGPPCNPDNLGRQTCETLGLQPGELACDPQTCFLVLDKCGPGGLSSTGTGTTVPLGGQMAPALFGGAGDAGLFGGLFGAAPAPAVDAGSDQDGGADDPGTSGTGGGTAPPAPGLFGGLFGAAAGTTGGAG